MGAWWEETLCGFDLETTGIDIDTDRIVTACVMRVDGSGHTRPSAAKWLVNPGIPIPEGATEVHGITTEHAQQHGQPPGEAIAEIVGMLARALRAGVPVVGFNVGPFDLSLLEREARRYGIPPLSEVLGEVFPILDGFVLDKHVDRKRYGKGSRKLTACCAIYDVHLADAHEASADAWAAVGVVVRIAQRYPQIGRLSLREVHDLQVKAKAEQDADYAAWLRRTARQKQDVDEQIALNERADRCSGHWPLVPIEEGQQQTLAGGGA